MKSDKTDTTQLMSQKCDGESTCEWSSSISDEIKDPCNDVFKYMTVKYACATPTTVAPMRDAEKASLIEFDVMSGGCFGAMAAAYNYYASLQSATMSETSHKGRFTNGVYSMNEQTFNRRMDMFQSNMNRWGKKLDASGCNCDASYAAQIQTHTSQIASLDNPTIDYATVNGLLSQMSSEMECKPVHSAAVLRKVRHARQILIGTNPNAETDRSAKHIKRRQKNWAKFNKASLL